MGKTLGNSELKGGEAEEPQDLSIRVAYLQPNIRADHHNKKPVYQ
jgi:hypothetical protein